MGVACETPSRRTTLLRSRSAVVQSMIQTGDQAHKAVSTPKRMLDHTLIPALIDAAGGVEAVIERWALRVRRAPSASLAIALGAGAMASLLTRRRR